MRRLALLAISAALFFPALASAAWEQPVGGASPINESPTLLAEDPSLTAINGVPYVAWAEHDGTNKEIRVAQLNAAGTAWVKVANSASPINESPTEFAEDPSLTSINGVPYVAWAEYDGDNSEIRVARLNAAGTAWEKVANSASPINRFPADDASDPSLTAIGGVPHVAWAEYDGDNHEIRVARLDAADNEWERIGTSLNPDSPINESATQRGEDPSLTAIGGVPYVAWAENDGTNYEIRVARLNAVGNGWEKVANSASPINRFSDDDAATPSLTAINGVPYVAWEESETNDEIRVAQLDAADDEWERIGTSLNPDSPINESATHNAAYPSLTAINGVPYVAWREDDGINNEVRVARLNAVGNGWEKVANSASPINESPSRDAAVPSLTDVGGVPYVAWSESDDANGELRVSRLEPEFVAQSATAGPNSADLSATWRTYGVEFPIGFEFGAAFEASTAPAIAPAYADTATITQQVSGLAPSTAYQYRSFALAGIEPRLLASASSFTTAAPPPLPPGASPDTTPPETTITTDPPNKLEKSKAKYKFASSEPNSSFVCRFDKAKPKPCDAGKAKFKRLDDGKHRFQVYAVDAAGNQDKTPAKDKFKVL